MQVHRSTVYCVAVRFASENIDSRVWRGLGTRNSGEVIGEF